MSNLFGHTLMTVNLFIERIVETLDQMSLFFTNFSFVLCVHYEKSCGFNGRSAPTDVSKAVGFDRPASIWCEGELYVFAKPCCDTSKMFTTV